MREEFERSALLLGADVLDKLSRKTVAVFGIGGVGGHALEALARCGIGRFLLVDGDTVALSNLNRQIIALQSTVGMKKTEAAKQRILDINPECEVISCPVRYSAENREDFDFSQYDFVIDAIDDVEAKLDIITRASEGGVGIISAMGAGNKLDPTKFRVSDIYDTRVCPLARAVRTRLKKLGVKKLKVVYSEEEPTRKREVGAPVGSLSFVPSVMGLIIAGEAIKDILAK